MSQACTAPNCPRPAPDGEIACTKHLYKVDVYTRQALKAAKTDVEYDAALRQAIHQMTRSTE